MSLFSALLRITFSTVKHVDIYFSFILPFFNISMSSVKEGEFTKCSVCHESILILISNSILLFWLICLFFLGGEEGTASGAQVVTPSSALRDHFWWEIGNYIWNQIQVNRI